MDVSDDILVVTFPDEYDFYEGPVQAIYVDGVLTFFDTCNSSFAILLHDTLGIEAKEVDVPGRLESRKPPQTPDPAWLEEPTPLPQGVHPQGWEQSR